MGTTFTVRRAISSDRPAIQSFQRAALAQLLTAAASEGPETHWRTPAQDLEPLIASGRYFVAERDGRLVAGAGWEPHARIADTAVVRSVFAETAHDELAAEMVRTAEDTAVTAGFDHILVPANPDATGFYRKLGYMSADSDDMVLEAGVRVGYRRMWKHAA
jgi:N-acetylglutamate synthase-like GNAT family acetyltransferase